MKIVPVLAITNAITLGLAIFLYTQIDDLKSQGSTRRTDTGETTRLAARVAEIERAVALKGLDALPTASSDEGAAHAAPTGSAPSTGAAGSREGTPPLASEAPGEPAGPGAAASGQFDSQEMEVFRHKVKKALELNMEEDQKVRVIEQIDGLVSQNKIAPLSAKQKEGIATTVLAYRSKIPQVFQKLRESGALENASREDRGRIVREQFDSLRAEAQRSLEELMPAVDAKTYLDETMRDQMRGGLGGFGGGFGGPPPQGPTPFGSGR